MPLAAAYASAVASVRLAPATGRPPPGSRSPGRKDDSAMCAEPRIPHLTSSVIGPRSSEPVGLRRQDEVAVVQAVDLVRPDVQADLPPRQVDVGVVPLRFRQLAD